VQVVGWRDAAHDLSVPGGIGSSVLQGETIMVKLRFALAGSLLLSGMLLAAVTQAEESFSASGTTCRDITWKPEVLAKYPNVAAACQGVVQQGGETYAKFVGTVVQNSPAGLRMRFKGSPQTVLVKPTANQKISIGGQTFSPRDMEAGQELTFYVPASRFAASLGDEPQVVEVVEIVEITPISAAPAAMPSGEPAALPKTASSLPWLAVSGAFLILCASVMTLLRRRLSRARK
jgi:LPXTG-motif cell wall-anchored protein